MKSLDDILADAFGKFEGILDKLTTNLTGTFTSPTAPLQAAGSAASLAGFPELGAAISQVTESLQQLFDITKQLVGVISPSTIELFDQAIKNVQATMGEAFIPLFNDFIAVFRQANNIIAPAFKALQPIVQKFADLFSNFLLKYIQIAADYFSEFVSYLEPLLHVLEPLLEVLLLIVNISVTYSRLLLFFVEIFLKFSGIKILLDLLTVALKALNGVMRIVQEAFNIFQIVIDVAAKAFEDWIASFFDVKDVFDALNKAIQWVIKNMYVLAVQIAKMFGLNSVADAIIKSLEGEGQTAAQETSIKSFEQISKDVAQKAAGAGLGGEGGVADEREFWKQTLEAAKAAKADTLSFQEMVRKGFDDVKNEISKLVPRPLRQAAEIGNKVVEKASKNKGAIAGAAAGSFLGPLGTAAGGWLGSQFD